MAPLREIARLFGEEPTLVRGDETFSDGEWKFGVSPWRVPTVPILCEILAGLPPRDTAHLTASVDGGSIIALASTSENEVSEFIKELAVYHGIEDGQNTLEVDLRITKRMENLGVSVYSFSHFDERLQGLNVKQLLAAFDPICSGETGGHCVLFEPSTAAFGTRTLTFSHLPEPAPRIKRGALLAARKDVCHSEGNLRSVLPEDFHLNTRSTSIRLNELFDRLCTITLLSFLSDVSSLSQDGTFAFKVIGYRAITGTIQSQNVSEPLLNELYKVYQWVYSEGSTADKLGLARNIISLHWKGDISVAPDEGIYESILSGYALYLKEHVDRYISLKQSLSDYLSAFSQKSSKLVESVGEKLERNFMAFVGFFISTILVKAVTERDFGGMFPKPLQIIAWGLIAASFVHGAASLWLSIRERERVIEEFNLLRLRYSDLLHKSDLDRVLGEDKGFRKTTDHMDFKLRLFFGTWVLMLLICAGVVIGLSRTMKVASSSAPYPTNSPSSLSGSLTNTSIASTVAIPAVLSHATNLPKPSFTNPPAQP